MRTRFFVAAAALAAALSVGVGTAAAHGGPGFALFGGPSVSSLVTQAAKELGVTRAKLVGAIQDSAATHITNAADDGDLSASRAADLKDEASDNLNVAYSLSETKTVASNLGITTTALNTGFRNARKSLATAKIDAAVSSGALTSDQGSTLKSKLTDANLPGYKVGFGLGFGGGFGFRGFGGFGGGLNSFGFKHGFRH